MWLRNYSKLPKMSPAVRSLITEEKAGLTRSNITSVDELLSIAEASRKSELYHCFKNWYNSSTSPTYSGWEKILQDKIVLKF